MMSTSVQDQIAKLRDFHTRSAAKYELLRIGTDAVEPLLEALKDPSEGVRWSAASLLGELKDERSIDPLIEALEDSSLAGTASDALAAITGEDFGEDAENWRKWRRGEPVEDFKSSPTTKKMLTGPELVRQALKGLADEIQESGQNFIIAIPLEGGRTQKVRVNPSHKDSEDNPVVFIETICCPAEPKHHEWALRQNTKLPFGALAICDVANKPHYVMVNTLLRETADPPEVRTSVLTLARWGDAIEKSIGKEDIR